MKYVRLNYGKIEPTSDNKNVEQLNDIYKQFGLDQRAIKIGDTIEELCDEFVFEDMDGHYLCDFCEQTDIDVGSKFDELKYWFNHSKEQQYKIRNCYGAIWTDKGLLYVAKMNEKGELELL